MKQSTSSTHRPIHPNPNQGKNLMTSTTKKKTTATIMAPPTSTAAPPSPALMGTPAIISANPGTVRGKTQLVNGLVTLVGALTADYAASDTFELPSGTFTIPELTQEFDVYIAAAAAVGAADLAYHAAVAKEQELRASVLALRAELKAYIAARIGKSATAMASYGFVPAKTPVISSKAKVAGAVKAEATRLARGTMGSKQKLAITGNVTSVTITPVTSQAAAPTQATAPTLPAAVTIPPAKS
jgi:hypothetical protein